MTKPNLVHFLRPSRVILWCLIVSCHLLIIVFLSRINGWVNTEISIASMTILPINRALPQDLVPLPKHVTNKSQLKLQEIKNSMIKSAQTNKANDREQVYVENASANEFTDHASRSEVAGKDLTNFGSISSRYKLQLPKSDVEENLTPAQQAAQDVRSNSAKLTKSEKFSVAMGTLDCVFQTRLSDGKVVREPGKWIIVTARSNVTKLALATSRYCVRLHQAEDENGNDLTAISAGIKGKL